MRKGFFFCRTIWARASAIWAKILARAHPRDNAKLNKPLKSRQMFDRSTRLMASASDPNSEEEQIKSRQKPANMTLPRVRKPALGHFVCRRACYVRLQQNACETDEHVGDQTNPSYRYNNPDPQNARGPHMTNHDPVAGLRQNDISFGTKLLAWCADALTPFELTWRSEGPSAAERCSTVPSLLPHSLRNKAA